MDTTEGAQAAEDSREIGSVVLCDKIPCFTMAAASIAAMAAVDSRREVEVTVWTPQG